MDDLNRKAKRVKPLIRAKQSNMEREASELERIRLEKRQAMSELKRYEKLYIEGVDSLNNERQSLTRERLELMEHSVDHYKDMWYKSLKHMREIESKERSQLSQLLMARQDLKSMEMLEERYRNQLVDVEKQKEQKNNDEAAIRTFVRQQN